MNNVENQNIQNKNSSLINIRDKNFETDETITQVSKKSLPEHIYI